MWQNDVSLDLQWFFAALGCLLPRARRSEWKREWLSEIWHCGRSQTVGPFELRKVAIGAIPDACVLLIQEGFARRIREALGAPSSVVACSIAFTLLMALVTNGFSGAERALSARTKGVVLIRLPNPFMGGRESISTPTAQRWLAARQIFETSGIWISGEAAHGGQVVYADAAARSLLSTWISGTEPLGNSLPRYVGFIARLRPGVSIDDAQRELSTTIPGLKNRTKPEVVLLSELRQVPPGMVILLSCLCGLACLSAAVTRKQARCFVILRALPLYAFIGLFWLELLGRMPFTETGTLPLIWIAGIYLFPILTGLSVYWWLLRDMSSRCRTCLCALGRPVQLGRIGCYVIDPTGIEYLCPKDHGVLIVGPASQAYGGEVWKCLIMD